ncbi:unnamed protein product [Didymodactylos carnosus]|uniref:Complement component 1 Q subcomponent-binding protein, mitochondrial n=1 Tax=Didymodactylos carnosus TaxID=1234261 RepID=A0A814LQC6_9BILA|nr:unnamed protein product [Didymodactylos carnosus]CAF1290856.1 unnamed protein product [Didymodactylos carnosus]CAF3836297.1 unnamed protein product [Didymodactylos carnosus]CAF4095696.1 unnamed protein product [Didymodactylos carnosus]
MAFRSITRSFVQLAQRTRTSTLSTALTHRNYSVNAEVYNRYNTLFHQKQQSFMRCMIARSMSNTVKAHNNAYQDLNAFLDKEIKLEKQAQKHPSKMPKIEGFEVKTEGPEVTLLKTEGNEKITVKFNVTNTVNAGNDEHSDGQEHEISGNAAPEAAESTSSSQLKSRPVFTVDVNRGSQTLSFLCSYLPDEYPDSAAIARNRNPGEQSEDDDDMKLIAEDFQIDEFAIHDGEWTDSTYSADCSVIDGELYDKLLNVLEERGIGEEFANQLMDYSTAHEHKQYINLLEKLQQFVKK